MLNATNLTNATGGAFPIPMSTNAVVVSPFVGACCVLCFHSPRSHVVFLFNSRIIRRDRLSNYIRAARVSSGVTSRQIRWCVITALDLPSRLPGIPESLVKCCLQAVSSSSMHMRLFKMPLTFEYCFLHRRHGGLLTHLRAMASRSWYIWSCVCCTNFQPWGCRAVPFIRTPAR